MNQEPELESDALRSEIDSTRGRIDDTIDALENRMKGRHLVDEIVGFFRRSDSSGEASQWKQKLSDSAGSVVDSVKAHPVPLLMIGAGIGWLIYQNRSSSSSRGMSSGGGRNYDYTGEDYLSGDYESYGSASSGAGKYGSESSSGSASSGLAGKASELGSMASELGSQAKDKLSSLGSQARDKVADLSSRGKEKLGAVGEKASQLGQEAKQRGREIYDRTRERVVTTADQHPLEVGIGFLALGVIAGMAIPTPEAVTRRLSPVASRLREASSDLIQKGKRVAEAATQAAKVEAKTQGLTLERVRDQAGAVAEKAGEAAKQTAEQEGLPTGGVSGSDPSSQRPSV